jgi:pyruvate/2-oxoglutarate/acetoin dehydrogenase E1 component
MTDGAKGLNFLQSINRAMREELAADPAVYILGEDVAVGGPYGATRGLAEEFGENRVINTPISESTVVGLSIGAALQGLRPIVEVMFMDFITLAMDQLVNHGAKLRYMSGGQLKVPLTIRTLAGASGAWGAHHSQSLEAWLAHVPGLKVVMPSTAAEAEGLLRAAIRDDNPVVFIENEGLYNTKGEVPEDEYLTPLGKAAIHRQGKDVSLVSHSRMVLLCLQAAEELAKEGIDAEVVDLRSLRPLDAPTLRSSVEKTNHAVLVEEGWGSYGISAETAATIYEAAFDFLDAPLARVSGVEVPMPYAKRMEQACIPTVADIAAAAKKTLGKAA